MIREVRFIVATEGNGVSTRDKNRYARVSISRFVHPAVDINHPLAIWGRWSKGSLAEGGPVESNERYYRRRAVEERMAAQRAVTETARVWHAKLAEDFAARASEHTAAVCATSCSQAAIAG